MLQPALLWKAHWLPKSELTAYNVFEIQIMATSGAVCFLVYGWVFPDSVCRLPGVWLSLCVCAAHGPDPLDWVGFSSLSIHTQERGPACVPLIDLVEIKADGLWVCDPFIMLSVCPPLPVFLIFCALPLEAHAASDPVSQATSSFMGGGEIIPPPPFSLHLLSSRGNSMFFCFSKEMLSGSSMWFYIIKSIMWARAKKSLEKWAESMAAASKTAHVRLSLQAPDPLSHLQKMPHDVWLPRVLPSPLSNRREMNINKSVAKCWSY